MSSLCSRLAAKVARSHAATLSSQRGSSLATTLIALPVLGALVGGAVQLGLMFEAKATLNHAVLQAARAGMVDNASEESLELGLARGLLPLFSPTADLVGVGNTLVCEVTPEILTNTCIRIINPSREAFIDHGKSVEGEEQIPNDHLQFLPNSVGGRSGLNVQDANLLKVYVEYGAPMRVPLIGPLFAQSMLLSDDLSGFQKSQLSQSRLPIVASATVRMQSPLVQNDLMLTRDELITGEFCASPALSDEVLNCLTDKGAGIAGGAFSCGKWFASKFRDNKAAIECGLGVADVVTCFAPSIAEFVDDLRFSFRCG